MSDFAGTADASYAWNEWERLCLEAAGNDEAWCARIKGFGDDHLPLLTSVRSGYAYFALERGTVTVVAGEEPDFEQTVPLAASFEDMLALIAAGDPKVPRWS